MIENELVIDVICGVYIAHLWSLTGWSKEGIVTVKLVDAIALVEIAVNIYHLCMYCVPDTVLGMIHTLFHLSL